MIIRTPVLALLLVFAASAAAAPVKGDAANGKKIFESQKDSKGNAVASCTSCHGVGATEKLPKTGEAMPQENPIIAGQYSDYLSKALHDYKTKKRAHIGMQGNAGRLSEKEIADISAYLESLKSKVHDMSQHNN